MSCRADPMTASGQLSRPPPGSYLAAPGQSPVAAVTCRYGLQEVLVAIACRHHPHRNRHRRASLLAAGRRWLTAATRRPSRRSRAARASSERRVVAQTGGGRRPGRVRPDGSIERCASPRRVRRATAGGGRESGDRVPCSQPAWRLPRGAGRGAPVSRSPHAQPQRSPPSTPRWLTVQRLWRPRPRS